MVRYPGAGFEHMLEQMAEEDALLAEDPLWRSSEMFLDWQAVHPGEMLVHLHVATGGIEEGETDGRLFEEQAEKPFRPAELVAFDLAAMPALRGAADSLGAVRAGNLRERQQREHHQRAILHFRAGKATTRRFIATPSLRRSVIRIGGASRLPVLLSTLSTKSRPLRARSLVRIVTAQGEEVPYALDQQVAPAATRLPLLDVQSLNGKETTALVDRGAHPPLIDRIKLEISDVEFIKPVLVEASPDRTTWGEIAHQSIFATPGGGGTATISFAPNDRRYLRFRFDDRNGPPIHPVAVDVAPSQPKKEPQVVALAYQPEADSEMAVSTLAVTLPAAHLPISELRLEASEPVFSRRVRVYERVWFRDEVSRRLVGDAVIERTVSGGGTTSVPVSEAASRVLELDVDRSAGAALHVTGVTAALPGRSLVFLAPGGGTSRVALWGSPSQPTRV